MRSDGAGPGLRELLRQGSVTPASVLGCPELASFATSVGADASDDVQLAIFLAEAVERAIGKIVERDAAHALFGLGSSTEGQPLGQRRAAAAAIANVKPESFRVRREPRLLEALAHALLVELASVHPQIDGQLQANQPRDSGEHRLEAEVRSRAAAYVRYRDADGFKVLALSPASSPISVGRRAGCEIWIRDDERVSREHARLTFQVDTWSIEDLYSRNGTLVGDRWIDRPTRLTDGDTVTVGQTRVSFHEPSREATKTTMSPGATKHVLEPSTTQRKILLELARPWLERREEPRVPPTDHEIADRLGYTVATVRDAIRDLCRQASVDCTRRDGAQQRVGLVRVAIRDNVLTPDGVD